MFARSRPAWLVTHIRVPGHPSLSGIPRPKREALGVVIHLGRKVAPYFIKIVQGDKRVSHVALVRTGEMSRN